MARYSFQVKKSVARDLRAIPKRDVARILKRMAALADEPRGTDCEKLSGRELYRVRQGKYRILYEIRDADHTVVVVKVAHRSKAYDNTQSGVASFTSVDSQSTAEVAERAGSL